MPILLYSRFSIFCCFLKCIYNNSQAWKVTTILREKNKGNGKLRGKRNLYFHFFASHLMSLIVSLSLSLLQTLSCLKNVLLRPEWCRWYWNSSFSGVTCLSLCSSITLPCARWMRTELDLWNGGHYKWNSLQGLTSEFVKLCRESRKSEL